MQFVPLRAVMVLVSGTLFGACGAASEPSAIAETRRDSAADTGPSLPIALGNYELTFASDLATATGHAGVPCPGFPVELRRRTFDATITEGARPGEVLVRYTSPSLLKYPNGSGFGFVISTTAGVARVELEVGFGSGPTEVLPDFQYLMVSGSAPTSEPATVTDTGITIPFWGTFSYCRLTTALGGYNDCSQVPPALVVDYRVCSSTHDVMAFKRR